MNVPPAVAFFFRGRRIQAALERPCRSPHSRPRQRRLSRSDEHNSFHLFERRHLFVTEPSKNKKKQEQKTRVAAWRNTQTTHGRLGRGVQNTRQFPSLSIDASYRVVGGGGTGVHDASITSTRTAGPKNAKQRKGTLLENKKKAWNKQYPKRMIARSDFTFPAGASKQQDTRAHRHRPQHRNAPKNGAASTDQIQLTREGYGGTRLPKG